MLAVAHIYAHSGRGVGGAQVLQAEHHGAGVCMCTVCHGLLPTALRGWLSSFDELLFHTLQSDMPVKCLASFPLPFLAGALDAGSDCCNHETDCWVGFAKPAVATVGDYHSGLVGCHWYIHRVHRLSSEMILMLLYFTWCLSIVFRTTRGKHSQSCLQTYSTLAMFYDNMR